MLKGKKFDAFTLDQNDKALIREQQGKHEGHDNADNNLQRQTHLDIIHK